MSPSNTTGLPPEATTFKSVPIKSAKELLGDFKRDLEIFCSIISSSWLFLKI